MGFSLTSPAPEKSDPTAKNRVWGFFGETPQSHRENRPQSLQPRQGDPSSLTKTVSGRTYWPSRDPIGGRGGINLYGMVGNDALNKTDYLGLKECVITVAFDHGSFSNPHGDIDPAEEDGCSPTIDVGCAANARNRFRVDNGVGVPQITPIAYPVNNHPIPPRFERTVDDNDCLMEGQVEERLNQAIAAANAYAKKLCEEPCCCDTVLIVVTSTLGARASLESMCEAWPEQRERFRQLFEYEKLLNCNKNAPYFN